VRHGCMALILHNSHEPIQRLMLFPTYNSSPFVIMMAIRSREHHSTRADMKTTMHTHRELLYAMQKYRLVSQYTMHLNTARTEGLF